MVRKLFLAAAALVVPVTTVMMVGTGTAGAAKAPKAPPFTGAATGTVSCTGPTIKLGFSPPLTNANTGASTVSVKGKMSSCTVSGGMAGETIQQAKVTGSFQATGGCLGLVNGTSSQVSLSITWKGKVGTGKATFTSSTVNANGAASAFDNSGNAGFEIPNPTPGGGTVTGSFAGSIADESFAYTSQSSTALLNLCSGKGIKKLVVTHGTITIP